MISNCSRTIQRLILLAAIIVGIVAFIFLSGVESENIILALLLIAVLGSAGAARLVVASALSCDCRNRKGLCSSGLTAVIGGAASGILSLLTLAVGEDGDVIFFIGAAVSFALFTLLLGGIVGLYAESNNCICNSNCSCNCNCNCNCQCNNGNNNGNVGDDNNCRERLSDGSGYNRR